MQTQDAIAAAVESAMKFIGEGESRKQRLKVYLRALEHDPRWGALDILTVESRVNGIKAVTEANQAPDTTS